VNQLGGPFTFFEATDIIGIGFDAAVFWNNHLGGQIIWGVDIGVNIGAALSGTLGESYTVPYVLGGPLAWLANTFWDQFAPIGLVLQGFLNSAHKQVMVESTCSTSN
jgi:hypothetical protein